MDRDEEINPLSGLGFFPPSTPPAGESATGSFLLGAWRFARAAGEDLGELLRELAETGIEHAEVGVQGD
ncbi:MAG: hypothetical protein CMM87_05885 [Rickettsiales bacterium]|nr:hypothetical protein [Rickettsiales bacterium]|tara:strand:+ start:1740 stop:1946 length:207 start_codon:yes stop_codon:yes gene_type:complete